MGTVYEAVGGYDGLLSLARAWHTRVMADEVVSHAFSHGFHPRPFGAPSRLLGRGARRAGDLLVRVWDESSEVRLHSGNGPHDEMDRRAIACFDQALDDVGIGANDPLRKTLHGYFAWATTTTMSRYHRSADDVPSGLSIPRWSWDGLVSTDEPELT
jgi:hemoglobin